MYGIADNDQLFTGSSVPVAINTSKETFAEEFIDIFDLRYVLTAPGRYNYELRAIYLLSDVDLEAGFFDHFQDRSLHDAHVEIHSLLHSKGYDLFPGNHFLSEEILDVPGV